MQISTKTEYAVRAISELAIKATGEPVSVSELCKDKNLPLKYIEQLFSKLKKNGLIKSVHGSKGGYLLNKEISAISMKDIMEAVDENISTKFCVDDAARIDYCSGFPCGFSQLWDEIKAHLENYFDSIKLDAIISKFGVQ